MRNKNLNRAYLKVARLRPCVSRASWIPFPKSTSPACDVASDTGLLGIVVTASVIVMQDLGASLTSADPGLSCAESLGRPPAKGWGGGGFGRGRQDQWTLGFGWAEKMRHQPLSYTWDRIKRGARRPLVPGSRPTVEKSCTGEIARVSLKEMS